MTKEEELCDKIYEIVKENTENLYDAILTLQSVICAFLHVAIDNKVISLADNKNLIDALGESSKYNLEKTFQKISKENIN